MKLINKYLTILLLINMPILIWAQQPKINRCQTHEREVLKSIFTKNYYQNTQKAFEYAQHKAATFKKEKEALKIPVVVHIIYNTPEQNLSDEVIQSQIDVLNKDYRRKNTDTSQTRDIFKPVAADAGIEFFLANVDPQGSLTNGITRTQTNTTSFGGGGLDPTAFTDALAECGVDLTDVLFGTVTAAEATCLKEKIPLLVELENCGVSINDIPILIGGGGTQEQQDCFNEAASEFLGNEDMKFTDKGGYNAWDTKRYLNIWVCNLDDGDQTNGILLGFATPPEGAPNWPEGSSGTFETDGVVIHYQAFGINNPDPISTVTKGRTSTHEVGHYLGLRHIWGDGDCTMDDGIEDTPDASDATQSVCDYTKNTCTESPIEYPDMIENYMDYSDDNCLNMFSAGQVAIMQTVLQNLRSGLLAPLELQSPVCDFTADKTTINPGTPIQFTDLTTHSPNAWYWVFGDGEYAYEKNPIHTYTNVGNYTVYLNVNNDAGFDAKEKVAYITVTNDAIGVQTTPTPAVTIQFNPATNTLQVNTLVNSTINVVSSNGSLLSQLTNAKGLNNIPIPPHSSGLYLVQVSNSFTTKVFKIVLP